MQMKRSMLAALAVILVIPAVLASCGASSDKSSSNYSYGTYDYDASYYAETTAAADGALYEMMESKSEYYGYSDSVDMDVTEPAEYENAGSSTTSGQGSEYEKKIIKNADISLEADDVSECYKNLLAYAKQNGGYEFSCESRNSGDYSYLNAVIKIRPENLDKFLNYAGESAILLSSNVHSNDISSQYYDSVTRLNTLRKSLEKYYEFLESTTNVKDMLNVQSEINSLTLQIEAYEGNIKYWNSMVAEATVTLYISPVIPEKPAIEQKEINWTALSFDDMLYLLKSGFMRVVNAIVTFAQWFVIVFVSAFPILVIITVIVIIIIVFKRRRSGKKAKTSVPEKNESGSDSGYNQ